MTFYHFTTLARFRMNEAGEFEWSADLLPTPSNDLVHLLGPDFAEDWPVWLTTEPNPKFTWEDAPEYLLRITVDLNRNSRRLVRYVEYLAKHRTGADVTLRKSFMKDARLRLAWGGLDAIWLYFGSPRF